MRVTHFSLCLLAFLTAGTLSLADDTPVPSPTKTHPAPTVLVDTNALLQQTVWKGVLQAASTNSPAGVVAVLKQDKHQKTPGFFLRTEDPVLYTRMQEIAQARRGAAVVLNGRLDPDITTILVTDLFELPKPRKPERK